MTKAGPFDLDEHTASVLLTAVGNPNGRPNSDVIRPLFNGIDVSGRPRNVFIIGFGVGTPQADAMLYEQPFEYIRTRVYSVRAADTSASRNVAAWWLHERPRSEMRTALQGLSRYIVTARVSKHRLFVWVAAKVLADSAVIAFARDDDYFFGVLHNRVHELWARAMGTQLREADSGFRYTPTTTFETFPFPFPPGTEPEGDQHVQAIAVAARRLVELRDNWLNPEGADAAELKKRTLTNLYNARPTWLQQTHQTLDDIGLVAYGWPTEFRDDEVLARLLELNAERGRS